MSGAGSHESIDTTTTQPDLTEEEERELTEKCAREAEETKKQIEKLDEKTKALLHSSGRAAQRRRGSHDDQGGDDEGAAAA